jgi:membrane protein
MRVLGFLKDVLYKFLGDSCPQQAAAMVLTLAFLLLVSLALAAALAAFGEVVGRLLPAGLSQTLLVVLQNVIDFSVTATLFALMYRVVPDAEFAWRDVAVGALITAGLFVAGKFGIGHYLGQSDPGTAYGAAGSLALVMIWVYYSAMIIMAGAVFTYVWAERRGSGVRPEPGAVEVRIEKSRREQAPPRGSRSEKSRPDES